MTATVFIPLSAGLLVCLVIIARISIGVSDGAVGVVAVSAVVDFRDVFRTSEGN
jgi:hypothetical protein